MATNQFKWLVTPLDSEATEKPQPSKTMNGGSNKIDWANPESPSTIPWVRRADYQNFISKLDSKQKQMLWTAAMEYKNSWLTADQILEKVLNKTWIIKNWLIDNEVIVKNSDLDFKNKGTFDAYETKIDENNADPTFLKAVQQLDNSVNSLSSLKLASENYQYTTWSTNVAQINNLIKEIRNAYTKWVYDTATISKQLGVDEEIIRKIQQGKASELVSIWEEYAQEKLKDYFRAEEDYDTQMQRTMEDYNLAKTNLDAQFNSAMQTIRRNLFDSEWNAKVWSAVAWISWSEYMVNRVQKQYQQNMDDLENNYMYSSLKQRASYIRAIQDYNTNLTRLGEDFDDAVKQIQLSVLQQFQEIDNKIMSAEDDLKALWNLKSNTSTAMSDAILKYIQWIENENERQTAMQNFIAANYWFDVSQLTSTRLSQDEINTAYDNFYTTYKDKIEKWGKIRQWWCWEPVNEYLKFLGSDVQIAEANDLSKYAKDKYPTKWAIAYFDGTQSRATGQTKKHGHTWIVVDFDPEKWTVTVLDSNGSKKMWLSYSTYKLSDVTGYYTPGKQQAAGETEETATTTWYREWYEADYKNFLVNWLKWFPQSAQDRLIETFWSWNNFVENAQAFKPEIKKDDLKVIEWSLEDVTKLIDEYEAATKDMSDLMIKEAVIAFRDEGSQAEAFMANTYPKLYTVYKRFQQYTAKWYIDTIINSKKSWATYWQLSDKEWSRLAAAFTPAAMTMDKSEFLKVMWEAKTDLEQNVKEIKKAINKSEQKPDTTTGGFSFWNIITWITSYFDALKEISKWEDIHFEDNVFTGTSEFDVNPFGTGSMFWTWEKPEWNWTGGRTTSMQ